MPITHQPDLFDNTPAKATVVDVSSTFAANTKLPVHRWFRFSAGFSATWAETVIREEGASHVLDPFAGSGTTLLAAEDAGVEALGVEAHPFIWRVASAKLHRGSSVETFTELGRRVLQSARKKTGSAAGYPALIQKCYSEDSLVDLDALRTSIVQLADNSPAWQLVWLALVCILRVCSPVGTAQWQYILPAKEKRRVAQPFAAFEAMILMMAGDMREQGIANTKAKLTRGDARDLASIPDGWADLVVTSPPYPNNYDYADATRLEMSFFREISRWSDLQQEVRRHLVRACSQHVPERAVDLDEVLASQELDSIRDPLTKVCRDLATIRLTKGGKKTYHLMVGCYFLDLARVWASLRRACASGSRVCFVIGDSAPYGIHVPVIDWFGSIALDVGFKAWRFERTRDRNVKWKNRKHRVPLCEGRLWVEG